MSITSHDEFLASVVQAAPQDVSAPIFERLLSEGYTETEWVTNPGATDGPCIAKNGDKMPLIEFLANTMYNAPIYSKTHVSCKCSVRVSGPDKQDVIVNAFGEES